MAIEDRRREVIPIVTVIVVVCVAFVGYLLARGGPSGSLVVEYTTYTNENYSFKFDYPTNWHYQESFSSGTAVFGALDNTGSGGAIVLEVYDNNIAENVFGVPLDNLINHVLSLENRWYENNENYMVIQKPTKIAIGNVYGVSWSATRYSGNIVLRFQTEEFVRDNYLYVFLVEILANYYPSYERIFENVIDSFSFLD